MNGVPDRPGLLVARAERLPWLHRVHPLAKLAGTLPALLAMFVSRDLVSPLAVLVITIALILTGARIGVRTALSLLVGVPLAAAVLSVTLGLWADPASVAPSGELVRIGPWPLYLDGWRDGLATGVRMLAIVVVSLLGGLSTSGADFVRSLVQQLRVPYRFGYAVLAAFRFVPRFRAELATIRRAHRVRGVGGATPLHRLRGEAEAIVPLLAAALRHADRVAIAMEARAFGYAPTRTERHPVPWRVGDTVFVVAAVVITAAILVLAPLAVALSQR